MEYTVYLPYLLSIGLPILTYFLTRNKNRVDINKLVAETELTYAEKYKTELESTLAFRNLLLSENDSLRKELMEVKSELVELKKMFKNNLCQNAKTCKNRS